MIAPSASIVYHLFFMIASHFFVAVGVRLQRAVVKRDGDPVHGAARPRPGGNLRPLCQGEKTEIFIL